ncbi:unnamed protein product [Rotaria sp. Silwood2]|nr:unnamed protein product [Rotaria sp. Silwood2]CAF4508950.1 unnamed protein product [Rotaria sp. Silwood2]
MEFTNRTHFHFDLKNTNLYKLKSLTSLSPEWYSSSIVHLNIKVKTFDDYLCLLGDHLSQLHTFIIHVEHICNTSKIISNTGNYILNHSEILLLFRFLIRQ